MARMFRKCFLLILLLPMASLGAMDFGLVLNQYVVLSSQEGIEADKIMEGFEYRADLWPRLIFLLGDTGELYLSAGLTLGIKENDFTFTPELLRMDIAYSFDSLRIRAGRMQYSDPLSLVASGLFYVARLSYNSTVGSFGIGVWYTGFLYKKNANITMTAAERTFFDAPINYSDFFNTYFAPSRLLASLDWEHPSIGERLRLSVAITGQIDFSNAAQKYHSQYLTIKATVPFKSFVLDLGGSFGVAESISAAGDMKFNFSFAWDFGLYWTLPTKFSSRLSLTGRSASGYTDDTLGVFIPVTNKFYGNIISARLPGISMFTLDYTARINQSIGASVNVSYFVRNDLGTYAGWPANNNTGFFLGPELYGRFIWSPASDFQINLGAGAFLPFLGDAGPNEKLRWQVGLTAVIAIY
jgi:hypothetical protein